MKFATISKSVVMGLALLLASSAFAVSKANLTLQDATSVQGTKLKAGEYRLEWDGTGPDVQVSILQGKKLITKVNAKVVDLKSAPSNDATVTKKNDDGSSTLDGIRFAGKRYALDLGQSGDTMEAGGK